MYRLIKTHVLLLIIFAFTAQISCAQHKEKETIYLIFKHGKEANCISVKQNPTFKSRLDTTHTKYTGKMVKSQRDLNSIPSFNICQEKFGLEKQNEDKIIELNTKELANLNIVDFDYFIKRRFEVNKVNKNFTFKKIYFLEKIEDNKYKKYPVTWIYNQNNRGI
ncbi:hypothetical protein MHTCC0001_14430 [Flavobacteriaceae bacterium MHTCC 0001]